MNHRSPVSSVNRSLNMSISFDFSGRRVLITGAGKGMGRDIAIKMHRSGAHVVAFTRSQRDLETLEQELGQERLSTLSVDCSDSESLRDAIKSHLPLQLLVNNAGIAECDPFLETSLESFDRVLDVNLKAAVIAAQEVCRDLESRGMEGSIVNVSSVASLNALPGHSAYCISKAGIDMLTKVIALEKAEKGIRCNSVNPTVVLTPMGEKVWGDDAKARPMLDAIPQRRFVRMEEVTNAVLFLLSDASKMTNGCCLPVDGGLTAGKTLRAGLGENQAQGA